MSKRVKRDIQASEKIHPPNICFDSTRLIKCEAFVLLELAIHIFCVYFLRYEQCLIFW